jgi:hypothetical protein
MTTPDAWWREKFVDGELRKVFLRTPRFGETGAMRLCCPLRSRSHRLQGEVLGGVRHCGRPEKRAKNADFVHVQVATQMLPWGGDVVFGIAHQHSGGIGASVLLGRVAIVRDGYLRPRGMRPGTRRATLSA